jgi:hypothetical protein
MKKAIWLVIVVGMLASVANAEWKYGIGTGLFFLNVDGDIGINTEIAGPVELAVDLKPDDVFDYAESVLGFGGYATDGKWMIRYTFQRLELEDTPSTTLANGNRLRAKSNFQMNGAELSVGQRFYQSEKLALSAYVGARYLMHEMENSLNITAPEGTTSSSSDIDNEWTDARFGIGIDVPLAEKWTWGSTAEVGLGESEGTYKANTGIGWRFAENWSTMLYGNYVAVDFENASKGDGNWYKYDVDEYGTGVSVMYHW